MLSGHNSTKLSPEKTSMDTWSRSIHREYMGNPDTGGVAVLRESHGSKMQNIEHHYYTMKMPPSGRSQSKKHSIHSDYNSSTQPNILRNS